MLLSLLSQASMHDDGVDRKLKRGRGGAENIQAFKASREQTPLSP